MHDLANTMSGRFGFVIDYGAGAGDSELEHLWDEVRMRVPIKALSIYDFEKKVVLAELTGYERYFFMNEAISTKANNTPVLSAKLIGGVRTLVPTAGSPFQVVEYRVELIGAPRVQRRERVLPQLPHAVKVFRPGVA